MSDYEAQAVEKLLRMIAEANPANGQNGQANQPPDLRTRATQPPPEESE